jgi:uncharacterized protein YjcR
MGAPPGNKNALKHGFYSKRFTPEEQGLLSMDADLLHEVKLLRAFVYRISGMLSDKKEYSERDRALLALVVEFCTSIGSLITRRAFQTGKVMDIQKVIMLALEKESSIIFPHLQEKSK